MHRKNEVSYEIQGKKRNQDKRAVLDVKVR